MLDQKSYSLSNAWANAKSTSSLYGFPISCTLIGKPFSSNPANNFTYVGDVVNANVAAATSDKVGKGEVINVGNGDNRSINQIADMIGGDRIYREPVIEPRETLADNTQMMEYFDWKPTGNLEEWIPKWKEEIGL